MSTSIQDSPAIQYLSANIPLPELDDTVTAKISSGVRIEKAKEIVLAKVFAMVKQVASEFKVKLPLEISEQPSSVSVNNLIISFNSYKKHGNPITAYNCSNYLRIVFNDFGLSPKLAPHTILNLYFDSEFNIIEGSFVSVGTSRNSVEQKFFIQKTIVSFDEDLKLVEFSYQQAGVNTEVFHVIKTASEIISFDDECSKFNAS
jgi:hypothetical protein